MDVLGIVIVIVGLFSGSISLIALGIFLYLIN